METSLGNGDRHPDETGDPPPTGAWESVPSRGKISHPRGAISPGPFVRSDLALWPVSQASGWIHPNSPPPFSKRRIGAVSCEKRRPFCNVSVHSIVYKIEE